MRLDVQAVHHGRGGGSGVNWFRRVANLPRRRCDTRGHAVSRRQRDVRSGRCAQGDRFLERGGLPEWHVDAGRGAASATASSGRLAV